MGIEQGFQGYVIWRELLHHLFFSGLSSSTIIELTSSIYHREIKSDKNILPKQNILSFEISQIRYWTRILFDKNLNLRLLKLCMCFITIWSSVNRAYGDFNLGGTKSEIRALLQNNFSREIHFSNKFFVSSHQEMCWKLAGSINLYNCKEIWISVKLQICSFTVLFQRLFYSF